MGCNGSKLDVASGNTKTTGYSLLRRRKSDVSGSKAPAAAAPQEPDVSSSSVKNSEAQKPSVGSGEEKSAAVAEAKEITTNGEKEKEKDGKEVKGESPENVSAESAAAGGANKFFSPADGRVVNGGDGKEACETAKTDLQDDKGVIGVADVGGNGGKPSGEDLKEPILVEPTTILERVIASKEKADAEEHALEKQTTAETSAKGP